MEKLDRDHLLSLHEKVDNIKEDITDMKITSAKQEINLLDHMKRTSIAEERLELFEQRVVPALDAFRFISYFIKAIVPIATLIGIYYKYFT